VVRDFFTATPSGTRDLQWTLQASDQPQQQFIYTTLDRDHFRLGWKIDRSGKGLVMGDTLTCTRHGLSPCPVLPSATRRYDA
jgi:hypothetical protein